MTGHTEIQTILQDGKPAFVVLPIADYGALSGNKQGKYITLPQAVVKMNLLEDMSLLKAWRKWLGMGQVELANKAGVTQAQVANFENGKVIPRADTLLRLSNALGVSAELLWEDE